MRPRARRTDLLPDGRGSQTFYLVTYLVEYTSVDKVVTRVKAGKTKPKEEVIKSSASPPAFFSLQVTC